MAFPHVPNIDLAGVITQVGEGGSGWSVGDTVAALLPMTTPAAAEYVAAPAHTLAAAPRTIELADAAALPSTGLAAWQSLFEHAALKAGHRVLINAAVTATASPRSLDRIHADGADPIVDSTATPALAALAGQRFDVVLNLAPTSPEETTQLVGWSPTAAPSSAPPSRPSPCRAQGADGAGRHPQRRRPTRRAGRPHGWPARPS